MNTTFIEIDREVAEQINEHNKQVFDKYSKSESIILKALLDNHDRSQST